MLQLGTLQVDEGGVGDEEDVEDEGVTGVEAEEGRTGVDVGGGLTGVDEGVDGVEVGVPDGVTDDEEDTPPSCLQLELQPSPSKLLPSSHSSPFSGSTIPFPHTPLQFSGNKSQIRFASRAVG